SGVVEDPVLSRIAVLRLPPPSGWIMMPDGVTLIVSLAEKAQLVYIDTLAGKEIKRVDVDFKPGDLALQGETLFAAFKGASTVYSLDVRSGKVQKEYSVGSDEVGHIACNAQHGLVYATTTKLGVYSIDPATGKVTNTGAKGFFLAVDPIAGKYVYTGMQPPSDGPELVFEDLPNGKFKMYWDDWGKRALMMKYSVEGIKLKQISGQNNAAVNGWVVHLTPDGKRIMILGGGGWRPKGEGAGGGYVTAVYNADNLESMVGQAPHGINIAFHPVLKLGVTNHPRTDFT